MKKALLFLVLLFNSIAILLAQNCNKITQYQFYYQYAVPAKKAIEVEKYFTNQMLQQEVIYGNLVADDAVITNEAFYIVPLKDIIAKIYYSYNVENKVNKRTSVFYEMINGILDSTTEVTNFEYFANNKVKKSTSFLKDSIVVQEYAVDAAGTIMLPKYSWKLNKNGYIAEKRTITKNKISLRIEQFLYNEFNKVKQLKITAGGKVLYTTQYFYNAKKQLVKEVTKTPLNNKKTNIYTVEYSYENDFLLQEKIEENNEFVKIVEYNCQ